MAWKDLHDYQPTIYADLLKLTPLHDFVLVQPLPHPDTIIIDPGIHMTQDYRWRSDRPRGNRYGRVVAIGLGDRLLSFACDKCHGATWRIESAKRFTCKCGGSLEALPLTPRRAEMHVQIGDVVVFPRVPANEIEINDVEYCFIHEEQHVLAIIEENHAG
jgi:co-chaperonin GroES (HSP10)